MDTVGTNYVHVFQHVHYKTTQVSFQLGHFTNGGVLITGFQAQCVQHELTQLVFKDRTTGVHSLDLLVNLVGNDGIAALPQHQSCLLFGAVLRGMYFFSQYSYSSSHNCCQEVLVKGTIFVAEEGHRFTKFPTFICFSWSDLFKRSHQFVMVFHEEVHQRGLALGETFSKEGINSDITRFQACHEVLYSHQWARGNASYTLTYLLEVSCNMVDGTVVIGIHILRHVLSKKTQYPGILAKVVRLIGGSRRSTFCNPCGTATFLLCFSCLGICIQQIIANGESGFKHAVIHSFITQRLFQQVQESVYELSKHRLVLRSRDTGKHDLSTLVGQCIGQKFLTIFQGVIHTLLHISRQFLTFFRCEPVTNNGLEFINLLL